MLMVKAMINPGSQPGTSDQRFGGRQHFLDWVRVLAFGLLIFYHTGMMFVDWGFHIESGHNSDYLKSIMMLTSEWRLDILFIVSGVAISFMVSKMVLKKFFWQRTQKLVIPLIFAIAVVVAPQAYFEALQKSVFEGSFIQFWLGVYFTFSWDERMQAPFPTYNHMWYVLYLIAYTLILLPVCAFIESISGKALLARTQQWLEKGIRIIWAPAAIYMLILVLAGTNEINHAFYNDWYGHAIYCFAVLMGLVFVRMPGVWIAFERNRFLALAIGLTAYCFQLTHFHAPELLPEVSSAVFAAVEMVLKWSWMALVIGFARRHLNFTNTTLSYCNQAVYPVFILHQTVIIVLGFYVIDLGMSGIAEYITIALGTFAICGLLFETIKRINLLRVLFGLNPR